MLGLGQDTGSADTMAVKRLALDVVCLTFFLQISSVSLLELFCLPGRVEKSQSGGQLQRPSHTGNSPPPVMCGVMAWSCGR